MSDKSVSTGMIGASIILSMSLLVAVYLFIGLGEIYVNRANSITVKGYATEHVKANFATWSGYYSIRATDVSAGYATLNAAKQQVFTYLKSLQLDTTRIKFSGVNLVTHYKLDKNGYATKEVDYYTASQYVNYEDDDVNKVYQLAKDSSGLLASGLLFSSSDPRFFFTGLDKIKIKLLGKATEDAKKRAMALASNSGSKVGPLRKARQGVFQITPVFSTDVSDYGQNDTSTIDKVVKSVVTVTFASLPS